MEPTSRVLACLGRIVPRCGTVRALGSAALALAYVAAGWLATNGLVHQELLAVMRET